MLTRTTLKLALPVLLLASTAANAQEDKYSVTPEEHAACDADAAKFCGDAESEDQLLACMRSNRAELTPKCNAVFVAGLKKRHLPM